MYQGTTPSLIFTIKNYDLSSAKVFVSFKQNGKDVLTKENPQVDYDSGTEISTIVVSLSQEETLAMKKGSTVVQIRFIYANGQAYATDKKTLEVNDVIYTDVISYGGAT